MGTSHTDKYVGSEYSTLRRNAYNQQLLVAYYGLHLMNKNKITVQDETKNAIKKVLNNYKAEGGGTEYDCILD